MAARTLPAPLSDFLGLRPGDVHLAGGGQTPLPVVAKTAFGDFAANKADGQRGYDRHWQVAASARALLAGLTGARTEDIAFAGSASDAFDRVVQGIGWRKGDNVVLPALDFDTGHAALDRLAARGVSVRKVAPSGWICEESDLIAACDARTRLLYVSQVNALTGQRMDVAAITDALRPGGTMVVNDASHALGAIPVRAADASVTVASGYKFLLSGFLGLLIVAPDTHLPTPSGAGWNSRTRAGAAAAEYGNPPFLDIYLAETVLRYHARFDPADKTRHLCDMASEIHALLAEYGFTPMTPANPERRAQNICLPVDTAPGLAGHLEANAIRVWADRSRLRLSAQVFTDRAALVRLRAALRSFTGTLP